MNRNKLLRQVLLVATISLVSISQAWAVNYYRYKDDNGKTVMGLSIPPEMVGKGYDILNHKGRLIERVAPALTSEQIAARDAEIERQRLEKEAKEAQELADTKLKHLYATPDDAVRVMARQLNELIGKIKLEHDQIARSQKEILNIESKAAELQRKGRPVPEDLMQGIARANKEIDNAHIEISERESDYARVQADFESKIKRLELITESKSKRYKATIEALAHQKKILN